MLARTGYSLITDERCFWLAEAIDFYHKTLPLAWQLWHSVIIHLYSTQIRFFFFGILHQKIPLGRGSVGLKPFFDLSTYKFFTLILYCFPSLGFVAVLCHALRPQGSSDHFCPYFCYYSSWKMAGSGLHYLLFYLHWVVPKGQSWWHTSAMQNREWLPNQHPPSPPPPQT